METPLILIDPLPRTLDLICDPEIRQRLEKLGRLVVSEDRLMPDDMVEKYLPDASLLIGQTAMPRERLDRAPKLRAIFNVEGNFLPNVDYQACAERGIYVLTPGAAFARSVAESALAMAIDLVRGITAADRAFRAGTEKYGLAGNEGTFLFTGAPVGIIGFGDLGRTLRALLVPFRNPVAVFDPWLPPEIIRNHDCTPTDLNQLLASSRVVFVFASVTSENQGFIGKREFELMQPGSAFLLMSRAAVVDFPGIPPSGSVRPYSRRHRRFPGGAGRGKQPRPIDGGPALSAHRTGGTTDALLQIGRMTVADAELILRGLPPQLCRRADPAVAARLRSKPVSVT